MDLEMFDFGLESQDLEDVDSIYSDSSLEILDTGILFLFISKKCIGVHLCMNIDVNIHERSRFLFTSVSKHCIVNID